MPPNNKDKKPSPPQSRFRKQQIAEDTEREMTGRPQIHGAAMPDDENEAPIEAASDANDMQPGQGDPNAPGGMMPDDGAQAPVDPEVATSPEEAEESARASENSPEAHHEAIAKHHGSLAKLHQRLAALEKKGGAGAPDSSAPGAAQAMSDYDDDGR